MRAYLDLREARALCVAGPGPLPARLLRASARIARLLRQAAACGGAAARAADAALQQLPAASRADGAAAMRLLACLDEAYAEAFVSDALRPAPAPLPPPHAHAASLARGAAAPPRGAACPQCSLSASASASQLLCDACARANPQLAYLRLRQAEGVALGCSALASAALAQEGVGPGPAGGTMRGQDPVGCPSLRAAQAAARDRVAAWSAFAAPDAAAARALGAFAAAGGVCEVGAGTGYWARYLELTCPGLAVEAHDARPPGAAAGMRNEYHGGLAGWRRVAAGDAAAVAAAAARRAPQPCLLICYPPPVLAPPGGAGGGPPDMGRDALRAWEAAGGARLALVGEWRGDTGSAELEAALRAGWALAQPPLRLPCYANTAASLTLWRRGGGGGGGGGWPLSCAACGAEPAAGGAPFWRDRLTRAVVACGATCAAAAATMEALERELEERQLPPLLRGAGAEGLPFAWEDWDPGLRKRIWRIAPLL